MCGSACRGLHGLARTNQDCPAQLAQLAYLTCPAHLKGQAKGIRQAHCGTPLSRAQAAAVDGRCKKRL